MKKKNTQKRLAAAQTTKQIWLFRVAYKLLDAYIHRRIMKRSIREHNFPV